MRRKHLESIFLFCVNKLILFNLDLSVEEHVKHCPCVKKKKQLKNNCLWRKRCKNEMLSLLQRCLTSKVSSRSLVSQFLDMQIWITRRANFLPGICWPYLVVTKNFIDFFFFFFKWKAKVRHCFTTVVSVPSSNQGKFTAQTARQTHGNKTSCPCESDILTEAFDSRVLSVSLARVI